MKRLLLIVPFGLLLIVTGLLFQSTILKGKLPIPSDAIVALYHPYRDYFINQYPHGYPFKNFLITDPLRQQFPWRDLAIQSEKLFQLPLWNPYNGAGEPLLGNIQAAGFYPLNIIFFLFPFQDAWSILIFLSPLLAGWFLYLYLRNLSLSKYASILGGITFALSGFNMTWLEWGTIVHAGLWLPLIILSVDKIIRAEREKVDCHSVLDTESSPGFPIRSGMTRIFNSGLVWPVVFVFSLACSLLAGHLQTFFYVFVFSFVYLIIRWFQLGKAKSFLLLFIILYSLFLILTFIQWYPTFQLILLSARSTDQLWRTQAGWFIPWQNLVQFIVPDFFGNPATLNYWGTWNYGELTGYIGIFPLLLVVVALLTRRDKKTYFFAVTTFIAFLFALPTILAKLPFILHIPFISTSQPTRLLFIIDFCLAVLAALGFDNLLKSKKRVIWPLLTLLLIFAGIWLFVFSPMGRQLITLQNLETVKHNLILPTILFAISLVVVITYQRFYNMKRIGLILFICVFLLTSFDLIRFSWKFNAFTDQSLLFPQTKTLTFLQDKSRNYPWRFLGVDYVANEKRILPPDLAAYYNLYTLDTYNPLLLKRYAQFAAVSEWGFTNIPDFSFNRSIMLNNYNSQLIDLMGVKYVVAINNTVSKKLKFLFSEGETRVYENLAVFPRAFMTYDILTISDNKEIAQKMYDKNTNLRTTAIVEEPLNLIVNGGKGKIKNQVSINSYQENEIKINVTTQKAGLLVLTDVFYPTWQVYVDGKVSKIYRTDYTLRGVIVPAGTHQIDFIDKLF